MEKPKYINWIAEESGVVFEDNTPLNCYTLSYTLDYDILDEWALHLRKHYISDDTLTEALLIHSLTPEQYLREFVIPQKKDVYGPVSRSNDITEIVVSDMLEFIFDYTVPRCKQEGRSGKALSEHGTDVIAYKFYKNDKTPNVNDILVAVEVKAKLTSDTADVIISAANDSKKDEQRYAHTLDYYRKKLNSLGNRTQAAEIARFQQKSNYNYEMKLIGAAISSQTTIDKKMIVGITGANLSLQSNQEIFYIHGSKLMELTHAVYERCIK